MNYKTFKLILIELSSILFTFTVALMFLGTSVKADSNSEITKTIATYNYKDVSPKDMSIIDDIVANDNTITMQIKNNKLILTRIYTDSPELKSNMLASSFIQLPQNANTVKTVDFNSAIEKMDGNNGIGTIPNGSILSIFGVWAYRGQTNGHKVSVGTHVHCNRFNGNHSDHRYWSHNNPRSWIDFYHSDCDWHAFKYHCSMRGRNVKCDGLNTKHHGVHDCSSWKGGTAHKNWPKTCWYRN